MFQQEKSRGVGMSILYVGRRTQVTSQEGSERGTERLGVADVSSLAGKRCRKVPNLRTTC